MADCEPDRQQLMATIDSGADPGRPLQNGYLLWIPRGILDLYFITDLWHGNAGDHGLDVDIVGCAVRRADSHVDYD